MLLICGSFFYATVCFLCPHCFIRYIVLFLIENKYYDQMMDMDLSSLLETFFLIDSSRDLYDSFSMDLEYANNPLRAHAG